MWEEDKLLGGPSLFPDPIFHEHSDLPPRITWSVHHKTQPGSSPWHDNDTSPHVMASHREVKLYTQLPTASSVTWLITLQQGTWPNFSHSFKTKTITLCWIRAFWSNGGYSFGNCRRQLWVLASLCGCGSHTSSLWFITWVRLQQVLSVSPFTLTWLGTRL